MDLSINQKVGEQIRKYRKIKGFTIQELADAIHKSRATVSKYETGEISLDIETLFEIASVIQVPPPQLIEWKWENQKESVPQETGLRTFYNARRLYFYFYDGRYGRMKDGAIDILPGGEGNQKEASMRLSVVTPRGRSSEIYYSGKVTYSDMLIRFFFKNQYNPLEEDLLYIYNPLEYRESTYGLLCGISSSDMHPCAFKCLITLAPHQYTEELKEQLMLTKQELKEYKKLNMLVIDNEV